ncbi:MAG: choice-of-anchor D domain-containing protein, partial [Cyclobacteriaceae bacterium]
LISSDSIASEEISGHNRTLSKLPALTGETDSVEVKGLLHSTTYYLSLRAIDLLGKPGTWSNMVKVTTQEPPRLEIRPRELAATVNAKASVVDTLVIDNSTGKSPLSFSLRLDSLEASREWCYLSTDSGVVEAGATTHVRITWNARHLYAGIYSRNLKIISNDPDKPVVEIPMKLKVVGEPEMVLSTEQINFGNVYLTYTQERKLTIQNRGTDTLRVESLSAKNKLFSTDVNSLAIPPGQKQNLKVYFSPEIDGEQIDTLIITSNDLQNPSQAVNLTGTGLIPPPLLIQPEEVTAEVVQEGSQRKKVRLQNTEFKDTLQWTITSSLPEWLSVSLNSGSLIPREEAKLFVDLRTSGLALGEYSTEVIFRFSENDSVSLSVLLSVVEPNLPPDWTASLLVLKLHTDEAKVSFDFTELISDPEDEDLSFSIQSINRDIAKVQIVEEALKVEPLQEGQFSTWITATDVAGNTATVPMKLVVLPPNRPPEPVQESIEVEVDLSDEEVEINLDSLFFDPDGDSLQYSFERPSFSVENLIILESSVLKLQIQSEKLVGRANAIGRQKTVVYAYDQKELYSTLVFDFSVVLPNQPPVVRQEIDTQQLVEQEQIALYLPEFFTDPDEDTLMYQAEKADTTNAEVSFAGDSLWITARLPGEVFVQINAQDPAGKRASITFL